MQVVTYDASPAAGAAPACIQNTWTVFQSVMASREDEAWRAIVSDAFGTCRPLQSSAEVEDLAYWVQVRRAAQQLLCWQGMQPVLLLTQCHALAWGGARLLGAGKARCAAASCWRGMRPVLLLNNCHGLACNLGAAEV